MLVVRQAYLDQPAQLDLMGQMAQLVPLVRHLLCPAQRAHLLLVPPAQLARHLALLAPLVLVAPLGRPVQLVRHPQ